MPQEERIMTEISNKKPAVHSEYTHANLRKSKGWIQLCACFLCNGPDHAPRQGPLSAALATHRGNKAGFLRIPQFKGSLPYLVWNWLAWLRGVLLFSGNHSQCNSSLKAIAAGGKLVLQGSGSRIESSVLLCPECAHFFYSKCLWRYLQGRSNRLLWEKSYFCPP